MAILGTLLVFSSALGGCATDERTWSPYWSKDTTIILDEDEWIFYGFSARNLTKLDINVSFEPTEQHPDGFKVDIYVMKSDQLRNFQDNQAFSYVEDCSAPGARGLQAQCILEPTQYVVVLDNGPLGYEDAPWNGVNDVARLRVQVHASE